MTILNYLPLNLDKKLLLGLDCAPDGELGSGLKLISRKSFKSLCFNNTGWLLLNSSMSLELFGGLLNGGEVSK